MGDTLPFTIGAPEGGPGPGSAHSKPGLAGRVAGSAFALVAAAVGLLLTLAVAAALAVFTIIASVALALTGLAWRLGRRPVAADAPVVLDARKVGHAWVAYGWDEPRR
jgi:hypothetical protein